MPSDTKKERAKNKAQNAAKATRAAKPSRGLNKPAPRKTTAAMRNKRKK